MNEESRDLVPVAPEKMDLVSPLDAETILAAFRKFEWLMANVVGPGDRVKVGDRSFTKKSGCLKIALSCNMSLEKREERVERDGDEIVFHYTFRAVAPSGRFADADGSASSSERTFNHVPHDIRALAQTRACNRAILNLAGAGGGTVSFEEMDGSGFEPKPKSKPKSKSKSAKPDPKNILTTVILKKDWDWNRVFEEFGPHIEKKHKQLGEKKFSFEYAAVIIAIERGCTKKQELPQ